MATLFALLYDLFIAPLAIAYGAAYSLCSRALGYEMNYSHPSEIMDEIAALTPTFHGVSFRNGELTS